MARLLASGRRRVVAAALSLLALGMLVAVASGAINPRGGSYGGKTNQGKPVSFKVQRGTVKNAKFTIKSGICEGTFYIYDTDKVDGKGRFAISQPGVSKLTGKFVSNTKVKGAVTATFQSCPGGTKTVGYTARRR